MYSLNISPLSEIRYVYDCLNSKNPWALHYVCIFAGMEWGISR